MFCVMKVKGKKVHQPHQTLYKRRSLEYVNFYPLTGYRVQSTEYRVNKKQQSFAKTRGFVFLPTRYCIGKSGSGCTVV